MKVGDLVINCYQGIAYKRIGIILEMPKEWDQIQQILVSTEYGPEWWFSAITRKLDEAG
tara:strand:+ start:1043 stop:1219 length:177 start_codon:yes stop_codon:yes gene_type:complete